jgi:RimJ/RimL family protein N-acetyltransferase
MTKIIRSESDPRHVTIQADDSSHELRSIGPEDADQFHSLIDYDRKHLSQHGDNTGAAFKSVEKTREILTKSQNSDRQVFGIWHDGTMKGSVYVTPTDDKSGEVGVWTGKEHAGKGHAKVSIRLLADYCFVALGLDNIYGDIHEDNAASIHIFESQDFRHDPESGHGDFKRYVLLNDAKKAK